MTMVRRFLAFALVLCLMLPLFAVASADSLSPLLEGAFKQGAFASEGDGSVFFSVVGTGQSGLYAVPSEGGSISLLETQDNIKDLVAVGSSLYYLRQVSGSWQLVCRTVGNVNIMQVFDSEATVHDLGYYDGKLYVISNGWLYSFDALSGAEALVSEVEMTSYAILGGRIYYASATDLRTYQKEMTDGSSLSATAGCLYSMALDGSDVQIEVEDGIADLRGYGEYLYFHYYRDSYTVANTANDRWLNGRLYRYNIVTEMPPEKANDGYDWDFYPTSNGLLLYTLNSLDLHNVTENINANLMKPEEYTSVAVDGDFALVYQHTLQTFSRVPTNAETPVTLGETLPLAISEENAVVETLSDNVDSAATLSNTAAPTATKAPTAATTKKPTTTGNSSDYIFPESSTRKLTRADLKKVDPTLWAYGRNEIWARHGYEFNKSIYADYFKNKSWYKAGGYSSKDVTSIEWYNMEFIKKYEDMYKDEIAAMKAGATSKPSTPSATTAPTTPTDSSYIFPDSSTKLLTREDVLSIDRSLWGYARNEIYARHGYEFSNSNYAKYFANKTWYKAGGFSTKDLNNIEWSNMDLIKKMESEY